MSAAVTAPAPVVIDGSLDAMKPLKPITPRDAIQQAMYALEYIKLYGFLAEALKGNENTQGAFVLHRELSKARVLLDAVLAS